MDQSSPWGLLDLERRTSRYLGYGQIAALIVLALAVLLRRPIPPWVPLGVSLLATAAIMACLAFLFLRYGRIPLDAEKRELAGRPADVRRDSLRGSLSGDRPPSSGVRGPRAGSWMRRG